MKRILTILILMIWLASNIHATVEKDSEGNLIVKDTQGNVRYTVPSTLTRSVAIEENKDIITISAKDDITEIPLSETISVSLTKASKITISKQKDGSTGIRLQGPGSIKVQGTRIDNIRDANIIIDSNQQIDYAEFTSTKQTEYNFDYYKKQFKISANQGSFIIFNPKEKKIIGKNVKIKYGDEEVEGKDITIIADENRFKEIKLSSGSTYKFKDIEFTSKEEFTIYFNKKAEELPSGKNSISIDNNGEQIISRGKVKITNKDNGLVYEGLNSKAYSIYKVNTNDFDILAGNALVSNGPHSLLVEDGKSVKLIKKNLNEKTNATSFNVNINNQEGTRGYTINEETGTLEIAASKDGKILGRLVLPFDKYEEEMKKALGKDTTKALDGTNKRVDDLNKQIEQLTGQGKDVSKLVEERDMLELALVQNKVNELINQGKTDEAIMILNDYIGKLEDLKDERNVDEFTKLMQSPELIYALSSRAKKAKALAMLTLAELYQSDLQNQPEALRKLQMDRAILLYKYARSYDSSLDDDASWALSKLYEDAGDSRSAKETLEQLDDKYTKLIPQTQDPTEKSNLLLRRAMIAVGRQDIRNALMLADNAASLAPDNIPAKEFKIQLQSSLLDDSMNALTTQSVDLYDAYIGKIGIGRSGKLEMLRNAFFNPTRVFAMTVGSGLGSGVAGYRMELEGKEQEITKEQAGIIALKAALMKGYTVDEVIKADESTRVRIFADVMGTQLVDDRELNEELLNRIIRNGYLEKDFKDYQRTGGKSAIEFLQARGILKDSIARIKSEEYAKADTLVRSYSNSALDVGVRNPNVMVLRESGRTPVQFNFRHIDPGILGHTLADTLIDEYGPLDPETLLSFAGPFATIRGTNLIAWGAKGLGAAAKGTLGAEGVAQLAKLGYETKTTLGGTRLGYELLKQRGSSAIADLLIGGGSELGLVTAAGYELGQIDPRLGYIGTLMLAQSRVFNLGRLAIPTYTKGQLQTMLEDVASSGRALTRNEFEGLMYAARRGELTLTQPQIRNVLRSTKFEEFDQITRSALERLAQKEGEVQISELERALSMKLPSARSTSSEEAGFQTLGEVPTQRIPTGRIPTPEEATAGKTQVLPRDYVPPSQRETAQTLSGERTVTATSREAGSTTVGAGKTEVIKEEHGSGTVGTGRTQKIPQEPGHPIHEETVELPQQSLVRRTWNAFKRALGFGGEEAPAVQTQGSPPYREPLPEELAQRTPVLEELGFSRSELDDLLAKGRISTEQHEKAISALKPKTPQALEFKFPTESITSDQAERMLLESLEGRSITIPELRGMLSSGRIFTSRELELALRAVNRADLIPEEAEILDRLASSGRAITREAYEAAYDPTTKTAIQKGWKSQKPNPEATTIDIEGGYITKKRTYEDLSRLAKKGGMIIDVPSHVQEGRLTFFNRPADGVYVWVIDDSGRFIVAPRSQIVSKFGSKLPHVTLAGGRPVYGAGEVEFTEGRIRTFNAYSGHYYPGEKDQILLSRWNSQSKEAFEEFMRRSGLQQATGGGKFVNQQLAEPILAR